LVADKMLSADLLVLTSRWEGLPLVALEALALGRGIVAPDVGSCRDVVSPGENGLLYPPDATAEEIAALIRAALDPDTLRRWGRASRTRFERDGGMPRFIDGIRAVYDDVVVREPVHHG
jgi:glycosyltransferase involved in cell wall biosynthesis